MSDRVQRVNEQIDREVLRRHSNRVLHGHPSPTLWLERDVPVGQILQQRACVRSGRMPKRVLLYVGSPFCVPTKPDRCGFCLFPSEVYRGPDQLATYLAYLAREGELYGAAFEGTDVAAAYFGGGTANLYHPRQYVELMQLVRRVFPRVTSTCEVTVEGVAQLFTPAKLEAMREAGVTRVSMGVQQLDPDLLRLSGRKQDIAHVTRMLALCHELGLATNVDLIYGWPRQSTDHMLRDLETVVQWRVAHITHYELNTAGRTDFARRRAELPSVQQTLEMYRAAKEYLESRDYRQVTPHDWERVDAGAAAAYSYEALGHMPLEFDADGHLTGCDLWGWGFAGLTVALGSPDAPGWTFMNCRRVDDYYRRLDEGVFPVERGYHYETPDLPIYVLFKMLQGLTVNRPLYRRLFGSDPVEEHEAVWSAVVARGWARLEAERLTLVGDGGFHLPLIQGLLAEDRLEVMRRTRPAHEKPEALLDSAA